MKISISRQIVCIGLTMASALAEPVAFGQVPDPGSEGKIQLEWLKDYSAALKKAETEKKPLLIDITTDWCGWSKKMERETFANTAVQKELRSFVLLRLNPEASEQNGKIAESYGGDSYPTLVVANFRGEQIGQDSGYKTSKELMEYLRKYLPLFKGNLLGYKSVQLSPEDPLMLAIKRIPKPDSRPTAVGAFIVLDQSTIRVQTNGSAHYLNRTATFVNDPEKGDLPNASMHYVSSRQKAKFRSVRIFDTKGQGREVDLKLAKDEHAYSNQNIYWDVRTLSVELPTLKEGQILDVIEELDNQPIMPRQFCSRWNTGVKILLSSDLSLTFPASMNLQKKSFRCANEIQESRNSDGSVTWRLLTSNSKPYEPLMFSPPLYEIWEGYEFFTPCSKDAVAQWFAGLCQGRETLPLAAKQTIMELKKSNVTQTAMLQAILDWVTKDIRYVSVAFGASSHQPQSVSNTLANLYGDCKDQSLLVKSLCREVGIPAAMVLLDAYGEPCSQENVAIEHFNHCVVQATADGKEYILDPAAGPSKLGRISPIYAGTKALKLEANQGTIISLPEYQAASDDEQNETTVKLNPNGSGMVVEKTHLNGQKAAQMKERMKNSQPEKLRKYLEDSYKRSGRKLLDFYMTDASATGDNYETRISYTVPRFGSMTAGGLVFHMGGQNERDWLEALNMPRTQPFWFRATDVSKLVFTVELPPGASLKGRPSDVLIETPFMKATRKLNIEQNKVSVSESSQMLTARLDSKESTLVYDTFRKLQDNRDYAFVVELPKESKGGN